MINIRQYNTLRPVLGNKYEQYKGKLHEQETATNFNDNQVIMN